MTSFAQTASDAGLSRRKFLQNMFLTAGSVTAASYLTACGGSDGSPQLLAGSNPVDMDGLGSVQPFQSQFAAMGPLLGPDENGVRLPKDFTSRVIAEFGSRPVAGSDYVWHADPDGGGTFRTDDGGWIYVSNSEVRDGTTFGQARPQAEDVEAPFVVTEEAIGGLGDDVSNMEFETGPVGYFRGGVGALRFDANGLLIDAYSIQNSTTTNCSGGATPWGTWINGEEIQDGFMFECSPLRDGGEAVCLEKFGRKGHEMVAIDPDGKAIYHTEDAGGNDRFYRNIFSDISWPDGGRPDMDDTTLQVLFVPAGKAAALQGPTPIVWNDAINDGTPQPEVYDDTISTEFEGNEGVWYLNGFIFFSTKSDDSIWAIDVEANTIENIYNRDNDGPIGSPVDDSEAKMTGVDNICMTLDGEMLVVEDGGFMRCMVLLPDRTTIPLLQLPGDETLTEVTGVAIGPTGDKVYVSGQRSSTAARDSGTAPGGGGVTYEITMPFKVRVDRPLAQTLS